MKTRLLLAISFLIIGCSRSAKEEPIYIGFVGSSGDGGVEARQVQAGMQAALKEINDDSPLPRGRLLGIRAVSVEGKPRSGAEAVRLLAVNRVAGLIAGPGLDRREDVMAAARTRRAPLILLEERPTAEEGAVLLMADPAQRGRELAAYALKEWKTKKIVAVVDEKDTVASAALAGFKSEWTAKGGTLRTVEKVSQARSPALLLLAMSAKKARDALGKPAANAPALLYLGPDVAMERLSDHLGAHSVHAITMYAGASSLATEGKPLRSKTGEPSLGAVLGFDAIRLLTEVLAEAPRPEWAALSRDLAGKTTFDSATGPMKWKDGVPLRRLFIVRIKDKVQVLKTINPE